MSNVHKRRYLILEWPLEQNISMQIVAHIYCTCVRACVHERACVRARTCLGATFKHVHAVYSRYPVRFSRSVSWNTLASQRQLIIKNRFLPSH